MVTNSLAWGSLIRPQLRAQSSTCERGSSVRARHVARSARVHRATARSGQNPHCPARVALSICKEAESRAREKAIGPNHAERRWTSVVEFSGRVDRPMYRHPLRQASTRSSRGLQGSGGTTMREHRVKVQILPRGESDGRLGLEHFPRGKATEHKRHVTSQDAYIKVCVRASGCPSEQVQSPAPGDPPRRLG